jgi:hypothetical protein
MTTPSTSSRAKKGRGTTITLLLLLLVVGAVAYLYYTEEQRKKEEEDRAAIAANEEIRRSQEAIKELAMISGSVVKGMTKYEVLKSMGNPSEIEKTSSVENEGRRNALISFHVFEIMHYYDKGIQVLLDTDGVVVDTAKYKK